MSRPVFQIILTLIRLAINVLGKGCRLLYTVLDVVDDGVSNGSVTSPEWFTKVREIVEYLENSFDILKEFPSAYADNQ